MDVWWIIVAVGASSAIAVWALAQSGERTVSHWALAAGMAALALETTCQGFTIWALDPEQVYVWEQRRLIVMSFVPLIWIVFSLKYSRGEIQGALRNWKWVLGVFGAVPLGAIWFRDHLVARVGMSLGGTESYVEAGPAGMALNLAFLVGTVIVLANLESTFRASTGSMRWRLKWVLLGLGILFAARIYTSSQIMLYGGLRLSWAAVDAGALTLASGLIASSWLRTKLFQADVYPSQEVLSQSLTGLVVGLYLLVVGGAARVATALGGDAAFPAVAFGVLALLVGLAMALLSDKVQQRIKLFVSRQFRRPLHDCRRIWMMFTEQTMSKVDEGELCRASVKFLSEAFEALSATVWVFDETRARMTVGASTVLSREEAGEIEITGDAESKEAEEWGRSLGWRVLEDQPGPLAQAFREANPAQFRRGGKRLCLPLKAGSKVQGFLILGDRVRGVPFSVEEMDLLRCIGDQVASNLLNIRLSRRLVESKEMEAFQTMSAFFVHDLKNTASTLSLLLRNLSTHFDDPAFRKDALRAISKSVGRINDLIARLSALREKLELRRAPVNLNLVVDEALANLGGTVEVRREFGELPEANLDREQIQRVVSNLVLNSVEALRGHKNGQIQVTTSANGEWVGLTVRDNGCGMTPRFLRHSLFRPFQTTKKDGVGIGMFQCKTIVEAHGGRMTVRSEQNEGTDISVFLPLKD